MKKFLIILVLPLFVVHGDPNFSTLSSLMDGVIVELPSGIADSGASGQIWTDNGKGFPSIGLGLTIGAALYPTEAMDKLLQELGNGLPAELKTLGLPVPTSLLGLRIGLPVVPVNLGMRLGYIPKDFVRGLFSESVSLNYTLLGFDADWTLSSPGGFIPGLVVGGSYSRYDAGVSGNFGSTMIFLNVPYESSPGNFATGRLEFPDPDMNLSWISNTVGARVVGHWDLGLFKPFIGLSVNHAFVDFETSMDATSAIQLKDTNGDPVASGDTALEKVRAGVEEAHASFPEIPGNGINFKGYAGGWSPSIQGGAALAVGPYRLHLQAGINLATGRVTLELSNRIQF